MTTRYRGCTFLGDWYRFALSDDRVEFSQAGNVRWLERLLGSAIGPVCGPAVTVMPPSDLSAFRRAFDDSGALARYADNPVEQWASMFEGDAGKDTYGAVYDALNPDHLLVGFEIPPIMRRSLNDRGFSYISLHNHPLRFLGDLAFGAYTNIAVLATSLAGIACNPREISQQVARFSARFARLDPIQSRLPSDIFLLVGQTEVDSSLIHQGAMRNWSDYAEDLDCLLRGQDVVAFIKHPMAQWQGDLLEFLRGGLGKTVVGLQGNSYPLIMSGRDLAGVVTLSSSLGAEAMAFGYECHFLLSDPRRKFAVAGLDNSEQIMLDHRLFEADFWHHLLAGDGEAVSPGPQSFYLGRNFVRGTLESWSFADIDSADPYTPMDKIIFPAGHADNEAINLLASALVGGEAKDFRSAADEAGCHRVNLRLASSPLGIGGYWRWDSGVALPGLALLAGFHPPEDDGAWSDGATSTIAVSLDRAGNQALHLQCEAEFSFFRGILDDHPALVVLLNAMPQTAIVALPGQEPFCRLTWSMVVQAAEPCYLTFECSHAASPFDRGLGSDRRRLGFILHSLTISASPVDAISDGSRIQIWGLGDLPIEIYLSEGQPQIAKRN